MMKRYKKKEYVQMMKKEMIIFITHLSKRDSFLVYMINDGIYSIIKKIKDMNHESFIKVNKDKSVLNDL